jgi:hypothetical protein
MEVTVVGRGGTGSAGGGGLKIAGRGFIDVIGLCVGVGLMVLEFTSSASGVPCPIPKAVASAFFFGVLFREKIPWPVEMVGFIDTMSTSGIGTALSSIWSLVNVISSSKSSSQLSVGSSASGTAIGLATAGAGFPKADGGRRGINGRPPAIPAEELLDLAGGEASLKVNAPP